MALTIITYRDSIKNLLRLERAAVGNKQSRSAFIRDAITAAIDRETPNQPPRVTKDIAPIEAGGGR